LLASAFVRRGRARFTKHAARLSTAAGAIVAVGSLAYLTLWWRTANAGFGWSAPVLTAAALLLAVVISLVLGHAVRITTLGVLAASGEAIALPPVGRGSWRFTIAGGALAFVGAAALLVATASADQAPEAFQPLAVVSHGFRLRVIAIDGIDPALFEPTQWPPPEDAQSPIGAIVGARYQLAPQDTSDPARAWTTIATGEPPDVHGVHAIETRRVAGLRGILASDASPAGRALRAATDMLRLTRPSVASRDERRSMMAWEVAEQAGLRTSVVNWWATWPASARTGMVLSDRAILRLQHGGALDGEIAPPALYPILQQQWPGIRERAQAAAAAAFPDVTDQATAAVLRRSAELDTTVLLLSGALPEPARDLDVVYLPGLDIAQHALLGAEAGAAPSVMAGRVAALRSYERFLRESLAPWLRPEPGTFVLLVTQPGRVSTPLPGTMTVFGVLPPPAHLEQPGIRDAGTASVEDIAPTILHALGVPLSRELSGVPRAGVAATGAARYVSSYGPPFRDESTRRGKPLDDEMIERLRSLGYVK
jgi:hypothetical protein